MLFIANFVPTRSSKHNDLFAVRINFSSLSLVVFRVSSSWRVDGEELFRGIVADSVVVRKGARSSCPLHCRSTSTRLGAQGWAEAFGGPTTVASLVCFLCKYTDPSSKVAQTCVRSSRTLLLFFDSAQGGFFEDINTLRKQVTDTSLVQPPFSPKRVQSCTFEQALFKFFVSFICCSILFCFGINFKFRSLIYSPVQPKNLKGGGAGTPSLDVLKGNTDDRHQWI